MLLQRCLSLSKPNELLFGVKEVLVLFESVLQLNLKRELENKSANCRDVSLIDAKNGACIIDKTILIFPFNES